MHPAIEKIIAEGGGVNVRPLAKAAGVSAATLYRAINRGEIEATQIGKRITIPAHVARKLLRLPEPAGESA
ncbi:helix-turn-helix domain-containing protein [Enterovirga sp.]|uniref:helix-turn-helix domain-containing protein n=1 Tax=Enterovirga sp. TaxID=2026350 RepID=UPI002C1A2210|nr:helix-turn-helix domain-containing protein [Enterovirga sp.]HMO31046.1 helix-turn-helix domain-containing protein [Enterovirga sp.]